MRPQVTKRWESIIDQLYQHLEEHDRHVALLRSIDLDILRGTKAPMEILDTTIPELLNLTGVGQAHLCRKHASHFALTRSYGAGTNGSPTDVPKCTFQEANLEQIRDGERLLPSEAKWLFDLCDSDKRSIIPVRLKSQKEL